MKFIIVGYGFVGRAIAAVLEENHIVDIIDPREQVGFMSGIQDIKKIKDPDGFIICVPTPEDEHGWCDDSLVCDYVQKITEYHPQAEILIKSTTSIDTLRGFRAMHRVTFSPEFLRGSNATTDPTRDFKESTFAIFGGTGGRFWYEVFDQVQNIEEVRFLDIESAGFLKYAENAFLATKVMLFNELHELYQQGGCTNWDAMVEALALDKRIGLSHTQVPGPDGKYGFGGHCLPKDTHELVKYADYKGAPIKILETVRLLNEQYRRRK